MTNNAQEHISQLTNKAKIKYLDISNRDLSGNVDLKEFSELTRNFSGAEIEGLVRAAMSFAMNRHIKVNVLFHFIVTHL